MSKGKKSTLKFTIDCAVPVQDNILDPASFVRALRGRAARVRPRVLCGGGGARLVGGGGAHAPRAAQEKFLTDKIKVNGKAGKLGESGELALTRVLASTSA